MENILFYDIESIPRLFSLASFHIRNGKPRIEVYYLYNPGSPDGNTGCVFLAPDSEAYVRYKIFSENPNLDRSAEISFHCLLDEDANRRLAETYGCVAQGLTVNYPLVRDVDPGYDPKEHPFLAGYNILNYDMVMLGLYFSEVFPNLPDGKPFRPTSPGLLRAYNDELFDPFFKSQMPRRLRYAYHRQPEKAKYDKNAVRVGNRYLVDEGWNSQAPAKLAYDYMAASGRHLDVARLNEKQFRVGLKRLLGMLGKQIKEPEISLGASSAQGLLPFGQFADIIAYNCSDVIQLSCLMGHKAYTGPFRLKSQMLKDYPGSVYAQKRAPDGSLLYEPDVRPEAVRRDRLTPNASSAKLAAAALCPYGELGDDPKVGFSYPHPEKARERGTKVFNVLDFMEDFIRTRMEPLVKSPAGQNIIDSAREALAMYRDIEGRDFNATHDDGMGGSSVSDFRQFRRVVNVPYMGPDGEPTSCFVTFSVGGIHGCEYDKAKYETDLAAFDRRRAFFARLQNAWPDPLQLLTDHKPNGRPCRRKTFEFEGATYNVSDFLKSSSTLKKAEWKAEWTDPRKPELFRLMPTGNRKLDPRYSYTSFGEMNHEDFTSYYPRMLSQMMAFYNKALGKDPYEEIFQNKTKFGKMMASEKYSKAERELYKVMRNGTKLILNSASGAADTEYRTSIRMNNRIIQMRITG